MSGPAQHWTVDDVHKHISNLQLDDFKYDDCADMFRKEIINGRVLLNLEKDDLNVLGINQFARRNALYQHLQELKRKYSNQSTVSAASQLSAPSDTPSLVIKSMNSSMPNIIPIASLSPQNTIHPPVINTSSMAPLVLPSSPVISGTITPNINGTTIKVMPPNPMNELTVPKDDKERNSSIMSAASITSLPSMRDASFSSLSNLMNPFSSPIYRASFAQMASPQPAQTPFSPNFIPSAMHSQHNILPIGILSPTKPFQRLSFQNFKDLNNMNNINNFGDGMKKEASVQTHIRRLPNELHIIEIPAIYQGVNSHNTAFLLMTQENLIELNEMYKVCGVITDDGSVKSRNIFAPVQYFQCTIATQKVQYGWLIRRSDDAQSTRLPFNPLIRFKLNILTDEIVGISPMMITGLVNHINAYGQAWISSDLQIDAIEEISSIPSALISNIISLKLTNISHRSLQQRDASYMIHDPEHDHQYRWKKGLKLTFCLKLSTRTNKKNTNTRKPVFVQSWNVKPL